MALKSLFPDDMITKSSEQLSLETVASKLDYFVAQIQLVHWQTPSHAEHSALNFYDTVFDFKDDVMEKLMGYTGRKVKAFSRIPIKDNVMASSIVTEVKNFSHELMEWAEQNRYCDVENISQALSGEAAKTLYLLTQS
jgi:hypothetical protein